MKTKTDKYFCICDHCGSIDWMNSSGEYFNTLRRDGTQSEEEEVTLFSNNIAYVHPHTGFSSRESFFGDLSCVECESIVLPLFFSEVPLKKRQEIYKMTPQERILFLKSFRLLKEIESANSKNE